MKIIICGIGRVGLSIASYLSMQNNHITIIDSNAHLVKRVSDTYDITGIVGHASQPDVLDAAGAADADILIAVTDCDEINMVACQVAHSIFGVSKKIARIRNKEYRNAAWANLFSSEHMPIDVIISPEEEIAAAIINRMSVPGTTNDITLAENHIHIFGMIANDRNKLHGQTIKDIYYNLKHQSFNIFAIIRDGVFIAPDSDTRVEKTDELYFIAPRASLYDFLRDLGAEFSIYSGNIIICGGGVIGEAIAQQVIHHSILSKQELVIVEADIARARHLNRTVPNALVLNGSALERTILEEAGIKSSSIFVSVMNSNESNILSAVLAKKMGSDYAIALSTNRFYSQLLPDRFVDAIVNPETITVSRILHNLRHGHVNSVHSIRDSGVEVIEARVTENCGIVDIPFSEIHLPKGVHILGICNHTTKKVIFPKPDTVITGGDYVVILAKQGKIRDVEKLFSFSVDLF